MMVLARVAVVVVPRQRLTTGHSYSGSQGTAVKLLRQVAGTCRQENKSLHRSCGSIEHKKEHKDTCVSVGRGENCGPQ